MNVWQIILGILIQCILGALWYGPLFGTAFLKLSGHDPANPPEQPSNDAIIATILSCLITTPIFVFLLEIVNASQSVRYAIGWAVVFGLLESGLNMPHMFYEKNRPVELFLMHTSYHLVCLVGIAVAVCMLH